MGYIDSIIMPDETLLARTGTHWFVFVGPTLFFMFSLLVFVTIALPGLALLALSLALYIRALLRSGSTELAVTTRRIVARTGFLRRNTVELRLDKLESLHVQQGFVGRLFDFGNVVLTGAGGTSASIPFVAAPLWFRNIALAGTA